MGKSLLNGDLRKRRKAVLFIVVVIIVCLTIVKLFFYSQKNYDFIYTFFIVGSSSMEPAVPTRSLVIIKKVDFEKLKPGDLIAYRADALNGEPALHRITRFSGKCLFTKGDANNYEDERPVTEHNYIGKNVFHSYLLGNYIYKIQNPAGFIAFFLLPISVIKIFFVSVNKLRMGVIHGKKIPL